jgi:hypothetical protein
VKHGTIAVGVKLRIAEGSAKIVGGKEADQSGKKWNHQGTKGTKLRHESEG